MRDGNTGQCTYMKSSDVFHLTLTGIIAITFAIMFFIGNSLLQTISNGITTDQSDLLKTMQAAFNIFPLVIIIAIGGFMFMTISKVLNQSTEDIYEDTIPVPTQNSAVSRARSLELVKRNNKEIPFTPHSIEIIKTQPVVKEKSGEPYILDISGSYIKEL
jgi:hypothetical protein